MSIEGAELKQSTVMSADVVGYTAMMAADAHATLSNLLACFRRVDALVRQFGGRIVDAPGDNMLIEFPNEVGAVLCAVEVQRMLEAARRVCPGPSLHMRIGVHAGQAIITHAGEWVQYSTPGEEGAEYVAICLPAFSIDSVHRDA